MAITSSTAICKAVLIDLPDEDQTPLKGRGAPGVIVSLETGAHSISLSTESAVKMKRDSSHDKGDEEERGGERGRE